jgi:hypothetical protein
MTQASVRLRPYGTISGTVLTRARLPIARIFGEIPAAKARGLVFVPAGQSQRAKGAVDLRKCFIERASRPRGSILFQLRASDKALTSTGTSRQADAVDLPGLSQLQIPWSREFSCPPLSILELPSLNAPALQFGESVPRNGRIY